MDKNLATLLSRPIGTVYTGGKPNGCHCGQGDNCGTYSQDSTQIASTLDRIRMAAAVTVRYQDYECAELTLGDELIVLYFS